MQAVKELDYVPNSAAASLRRGRTNAIGLVLDHATNPVFADLLRGAREAAAEFGYGLLIIDAADAEGDVQFFNDVVKSRRMDGLLLQGGYGPAADTLFRYCAAIPSVIINSAGNSLATGVSLEDALAAQIATEHLIELGHRHVVFVAGASSESSGTRQRGFETAMAAADVALNQTSIVPGGWQASDGYSAVKRTMAAGRPVTAFLMGLAVPAIGALSALAELGLAVPDDVSVVTIHDPWFARYLVPALTTVAVPFHELGRQAVLALMERLDGAEPRDVVVREPAPTLVVRGSTGPARRHAPEPTKESPNVTSDG